LGQEMCTNNYDDMRCVFV